MDQKEQEELEEQIWIAEYQALCAEKRLNLQISNALVPLNIVTIGTIIGLVMSTGEPLLLLVMSLVSASLGLVWIGYNLRNGHVDAYINKHIAPALRRLCSRQGNEVNIVEWSEFLKKTVTGKSIIICRVPSATIGFLIFFIPVLAGLIIAPLGFSTTELVGVNVLRILLGFACLLALVLLVSGFWWLRQYELFRLRRRQSE